MSTLTSKQRAHLRSLAHHLKPVVFVGNEGVTDAVVESVVEALRTRELVKIKLQQNAPEKTRPTADQIASAIEGASIPQTIGRTIVLYRPDPEEPEIQLP